MGAGSTFLHWLGASQAPADAPYSCHATSSDGCLRVSEMVWKKSTSGWNGADSNSPSCGVAYEAVARYPRAWSFTDTTQHRQPGQA